MTPDIPKFADGACTINVINVTMPTAKVVCFIRHGETDYNRQGLFAGMTDVPLNDLGFTQAKTAAILLAGCDIQAIWCSPMLRALQTAQPIADKLGLNINIHNDLAERNYGDWEGKFKAGINNTSQPPNGESIESFYQRSMRAIKLILSTNFPSLIVAHSGTFQALLALTNVSDLHSVARNAEPIWLQIHYDLNSISRSIDKTKPLLRGLP